MKANNSIRSTLIKHLFGNINLIQKKEFLSAKSTMFPGEKDFINFLKTDDNQELTKYGKIIISKLIYINHFPPPSRLLFNLHSQQENELERVREGDYIPQDHFIHIVHLYLLGIYFFSQHESLHRHISTKLNLIKRHFRSQAHYSIPALNSYELFSTIWAHFVLYHDIAYPLERISPSKRILEENKRWLVPFNKINKSIIQDLALKSLAKLIVISSIFKGDVTLTFKEMYLENQKKFSVFCNQTLFRLNLTDNATTLNEDEKNRREQKTKIIEEWGQAFYYNKINGHESLHTVLSFIPDNDIGAVLEDNISGLPIVFISANSPIENIFYFGDYESTPYLVKKNKEKLFNFAFHDCSFPNIRYEWKFFCKNSISFYDDFVNNLFGEDIQKFDKIIQHIENVDKYKELNISSDDIVGELGFLSFHELNKILSYVGNQESDDLEYQFKKIGEGFRSVASDLPKIISTAIFELFSEEIKNKNLKPLKILKDCSREEAIYKFIALIKEKDESLYNKLEKKISPKILNNLELEDSVQICYSIMRNNFTDYFKKLNTIKHDKFKSIEITQQFTLESIISNDTFYSDINQNLRNLKLGNFKSLSKEYIADWFTKKEGNNSGFIDHGFAAGIISNSVLHIYKTLIKELKTTHERDTDSIPVSLRLALNTSSEYYMSLTDIYNNYLIKKLTTSIILHNLKPSEINNENKHNYRTKLGMNPLTFTAMLVDALQRWDRNRLVSQAKSDIDNFIPGSKYNIEIKNNLIYISFESANIDFAKEEKTIRKELQEYLENADIIVKLRLAED